MKFTRSSGILLHPTSLPGPYGIGDLGGAAYQFVDFLVEAGQSLWQVLPLNPTGYGDSPYAALSSFAGNPLLISPDILIEWGDLPASELPPPPIFPANAIDFVQVTAWKIPLLEKAAANFLTGTDSQRQTEFQDFCADQAAWLDDFVLFMVIKEQYDRQGGHYWDKETALRQPDAMVRWQQEEAEAIAIKKVIQYYFFRQWRELRRYANQRGIKIIGDMPIFVAPGEHSKRYLASTKMVDDTPFLVAPDSADVWADPGLFLLDENNQPAVVGGVPPDYFSATGQLWGTPLYNWTAMIEQGFQWWIDRISTTLQLVDIFRIDHFRGFDAYWEIPAQETTAINGQWIKGPGERLFQALQNALGDDLPIIAEDLGVLTPSVVALRQQFGFPGMKVLQFAFDTDATNPDLPINHDHNFVVYTGTHDNDTTRGWFNSRPEHIKHYARLYIGVDGHDINWDFIRLAFSSVADMAIIPLQDVLGLGNEARMNQPGVPEGNWRWRYWPGALDNRPMIDYLRTLTERYGRQGETRDQTGNLGDWLKWTKMPEPTNKIS